MASNSDSGAVYRSSLGLKQQIAGALLTDYHSPIVEWMKTHEYCLRVGPLELFLAREFGFCYGVEKAVDLAYEARRKFSDRRIFLTHEIIHNPRVNGHLREMGIEFLEEKENGGVKLDDITQQDVVIIPAFGVSTEQHDRLRRVGCILVDTTCGSVMHVWRRVERFAREGFTALIHGKIAHEETIATKSRAEAGGGHYLVVRDLDEADLVCRAIGGGVEDERLDRLIRKAASKGFDPRTHLERIGVANQTTMLSSESIEIARRIRRALAQRHGEQQADAYFIAFDTICSATQNRQDAVLELVRRGLDIMLIVGGYNSSNTGHLCEISEKYCPSYHIDDASALLSTRAIRHKRVDEREPIITENWLPDAARRVGITAGASTPNRAIGETINRLVELLGLTLPPELVNADTPPGN